MNLDQKPDSWRTRCRSTASDYQDFTGKSKVLHSKTQKYMFWFQKNKHLFFPSYNIILEIHEERYPFVNSKSEAACVLHEEDGGFRATLEQLAYNCAGCATFRSRLAASPAAFSLVFLHLPVLTGS